MNNHLGAVARLDSVSLKTEVSVWRQDRAVALHGIVVDGSVSIPKTFRAQVGDSFIVTEDGYEQLTEFIKDLEDIVIS